MGGPLQGAFHLFVAPADGTCLFGAMLLYKVNSSTSARMRGRLVLNGTTEIRDSFGEISATHVSPAFSGTIVCRQMAVADGYFAAEHTSFWGCKVG